MRTLRWSLVAVLCFSTFASADLKIKTRTTVMGHTTESTVYIRGSRQRTETSFGGQGGSASIMQCDQKRLITVTGNQCMVMPFGEGESSCPARPNMRDMMSGKTPAEPTRAGGVVTITRTSTDTGERQEMFGYKARHIKSTMTMASTPDACNQSNMKMEMDGWYADIAGFSCGDESYRSMACGGGGEKPGCRDRIVMKGGGGAPLGYPLKQTMNMITQERTFTVTTEVVELTNATLEPALFDAPPGLPDHGYERHDGRRVTRVQQRGDACADSSDRICASGTRTCCPASRRPSYGAQGCGSGAHRSSED